MVSPAASLENMSSMEASTGDQLLVYRSGPRWHDVTAADTNDYLREVSGGDYTAKDFRTWHATVLAAVGLAVSESAAGREAGRKRAIARVIDFGQAVQDTGVDLGEVTIHRVGDRHQRSAGHRGSSLRVDSMDREVVSHLIQ